MSVTTAGAAHWLLSAQAVRSRAQRVLDLAVRDDLSGRRLDISGFDLTYKMPSLREAPIELAVSAGVGESAERADETKGC